MTYANVVATIALFLAMGTGGAYATHLVVNSSDVTDNSLRTEDVRDNDLKGVDIQTNTLKGGDLDESTLGQVPTANIANGAFASGFSYDSDKLDGNSSSAFLRSAVKIRKGIKENVANGDQGIVTATCNPGEDVLGGGISFDDGGQPGDIVHYSRPDPPTHLANPTGWTGALTNGAEPRTAVAWVVCAA